MTVHSFTRSIKVGRWAELKVAEWLVNHKAHVLDVSNDKEYRKRGIDFIVEFNGKKSYLEVKGDRYESGNLYLETMGNNEAGHLGCLVTTEATTLGYYFVRQGRMLLIPVARLQEWMTCRLPDFAAKHPVNGSSKSSWRRVSTGYPIPETVLRAEIEGIVEVKNLPVYGETD